MQKKMIVITHNGVFHADDVVAVVLLTMFGKMMNINVEIVRSRDPAGFAKADVVVDVGGVYDPENGRFDHHQRGCEARWKDGTKLSSAGMVWLHYGPALVRDACRFEGMGDTEKHEVREEVYATCIKHVDDLDNGQGDLTKGTLSDATLSAAIADFNVSGNATEEEHLLAFEDAVAFEQGVLSRRIHQCIQDVKQRMKIRSLHSEEKVLVLEEAPGFSYAGEVADVLQQPLLLVYPASGQWMVQCVPPSSKEAFSQRHPFPEVMKGLRGPGLAAVLADGPAKDEALADEAGAVCFVHGGRFIGGVKTKEAALDLAQQVLLG